MKNKIEKEAEILYPYLPNEDNDIATREWNQRMYDKRDAYVKCGEKWGKIDLLRYVIDFLNENEIDYRIESNFCCGYIFYFLDGSVYPRRYYDHELEGNKEEIICESVEHLIAKSISNELVKDWRHRIEAESIDELFEMALNHLIESGYKISKLN